LLGNSIAQIDEGPDFKVGINLATLRGDDIYKIESGGLDKKAIPGIIAGMGMRIVIPEKFVIQPEIIVSMKGSKFEDREGNSYLFTTHKLGYMEIPILLKYYFSVDYLVLPHIYMGPVLGFVLYSKLFYEAKPKEILTILELPEERDIENGTKKADFGISMGGGVDFDLWHGRIILDFRYTFGFLTINKTDGYSPEADIKNSVFSFLVGFGITI
jgi:hypothetical protein